MVRLADIVKHGKKQDKDYFGTGTIPFPKVNSSIGIVNQYPDSFRERKLSHLIGTFSSYMIRKMFRDNEVGPDQKITRENSFVAETVSEYLPEFVDDTKMALMDWAYAIENNSGTWIEKYLNDSWETCIPEVFTISQLDWSLQSGKLTRFREISIQEVKGLQVYLRNILEWLRKDFGDANEVFLKPNLSYPDLCEARPDIVVDDCSYIIKTVQKPKGEITKLKDRLLGCVSLSSHHSKNPIDWSPGIQNLTHVGYLFPLALVKHQVDVSMFDQKQQDSFIAAIGGLRDIVENQVTSGKKTIKKGMTTIPLTVGRISTLRQEMYVKRAMLHIKKGRYQEAMDAFLEAIDATAGKPPSTKLILDEVVSIVERWEEYSSMADLYTKVGLLIDTIDFKKQFWELVTH